MKRQIGLWKSSCLLATLLTSCLGPRPEVEEVRLLPPEGHLPYRVDFAVANRGGGEGEASVSVRLVDKVKFVTYQTVAKVELGSRETVRMRVEVPAPLGEYEPDVDAAYPPK